MSAVPQSPEEARELLKTLREKLNLLFEDVVDLETRTEDHEARIADLEAENEQLRADLEAATAVAEQAMVIASKGHDPDSLSKVEQAKRLTRNELLLRTANQMAQSERPLTVAEVQRMGRPDVDLAYQSVKDAWNQLTTEYACFRETTKDGDWALTVDRAKLTKSLTRLAEADLGRADLTKRLISGERAGGGPR